MSKQEKQDSIDAVKPVASPPIIHKSDVRSGVDRKESVTVPLPGQEFSKGDTVRKMNPQGIYEYEVHVVDARYDTERKEWMYKLTDWEGKTIPGETEETKLS